MFHVNYSTHCKIIRSLLQLKSWNLSRQKWYSNIFVNVIMILEWNNCKLLLFVIQQLSHKNRYRNYGSNWCQCRYCYCLPNCFGNIFYICKYTIINPLRYRSKPRYHQTEFLPLLLSLLNTTVVMDFVSPYYNMGSHKL